jgi:hypothetical protein
VDTHLVYGDEDQDALVLMAFLRAKQGRQWPPRGFRVAPHSASSDPSKALGLDVPWILQQRADEVIE